MFTVTPFHLIWNPWPNSQIFSPLSNLKIPSSDQFYIGLSDSPNTCWHAKYLKNIYLKKHCLSSHPYSFYLAFQSGCNLVFSILLCIYAPLLSHNIHNLYGIIYLSFSMWILSSWRAMTTRWPFLSSLHGTWHRINARLIHGKQKNNWIRELMKQI